MTNPPKADAEPEQVGPMELQQAEELQLEQLRELQQSSAGRDANILEDSRPSTDLEHTKSELTKNYDDIVEMHALLAARSKREAT